jgi:hypothetical protein
MKLRLVGTVLLVCVALVGFTLFVPGTARAQTGDECPLVPTISSLTACVQQASETGNIDNQGVANSLLIKLDAAQTAFDRGQSAVAIHQLKAFIHEVRAQAGKHIDAAHAEHMVMHARAVIQVLEH